MRDLRPLLNPRSVAIIGASSTLTSLAGRPIKNLLDSAAEIDIYPVNPKRSEIAGLPCYPDIESVPAAPDVALIIVPAKAVRETLEAAGRAGTKSAIIVTAGFGETDEAGRLEQAELAEVARKYDMVLLGPNTIGTHDYRRGLPLSFVWFNRTPVSHEGSVAVVTQSGSGMAALCDRLNDEGLPLGYGVATGNEADLQIADLLEHFAEQDEIKVVASVFEGIGDGAGFLRAVAKLRAAGKPLIVLKLGRTPSGSHAAASHTGSLAGEYATVSAILRQHGVIEIDDLDDFGPTIAAALQGSFPEGPRIAAISSSGAATVICADRADELGLSLPSFSAAALEKIAPYLPEFSNGAHNPLDLTAQAMEHRHAMTDILTIALEEEQLDAVIVGTPSSTGPKGLETAEILGAIARETDKPFFSFIMTGDEAAAAKARQREKGIYPFASPGKAVEAAERLSRFGRARVRDREPVDDVPAAAVSAPVDEMTEYETLQWLSAAGIPTVPQALARTADEAVVAAEAFGYPVALKISSRHIVHKTEAGGVALKLGDADAVTDAFERVMGSVRTSVPDAEIDGVTISPMADIAFELIAGIHRDPTFGPVIAFGLGGIWAEVLKDVAIRSLPISARDVPGMISELRAAPLLRGARGFTPVDEDEIARVLVTLSTLAMQHADRIIGLDLNPIAVTSSGELAVLDAAVFL